MNDAELSALIQALRLAAERLDCTLDVSLPPPATAEAIAVLAVAVGGALPDSLVSFLRLHDGMRLLLEPKTPAADEALVHPLLYLYGTDLIADSKVGTLGMLDVSPFFDEPFPGLESTRKKAYRCVPIASISLYNSQQEILFVRDAPQPHNEYAIIEAALDERQMWLQALDEDVELITIAASFEDFVKRAIGNVINGRPSFRYWNLKAAWVKYDGSSPEADASLF